MTLSRSAIFYALLFALVACGGEPTSPAAPLPQIGGSASTAVGGLTLLRRTPMGSFNELPTTGPLILVGGMGALLWVRVTGTTGATLSGQLVTWSSSDTGIVRVAEGGSCGPMAVPGCDRAHIYALGDGTATITASVGNKSASVVVASFMDPSATDDIGVEFSLLELPAGESWNYVPQIRVSALGMTGFDVIALEFTIPGVDTISVCNAVRHVAAGQAADMFREVYGDFELLVNNPKRAEPGLASATVFVSENGGEIRKVTVKGPVVPGEYPSTYTGGTVENPWTVFC